jgi:hypothetical protein
MDRFPSELRRIAQIQVRHFRGHTAGCGLISPSGRDSELGMSDRDEMAEEAGTPEGGAAQPRCE